MVCLPLFCTVFLLFTSVLPALSLNNEGLALLAFKQSIQQDPEDSLSNWNPSDENPCSWNGITCQDFKVISISIPQKTLLGILPSVLGSLSNLTNVNLRGNKLQGSLSAELFDASSIHSFVDDGSTLQGSVPRDVGKLKYLQTLDLSDNFFSGSIPNSVLQCRRLKMLDLSRNNFTGPLPVGFGTSLIALENLNLSYNQLSGSVPGDFGHLSSLQGTVDLSHNLFSGQIPAGLGKVPEKVYIDLTYNNLSGPIPQSGELVNRGPTAFIGNPGLCGPPLKSLCSSDQSAGIAVTLPFIPPNNQLPTISVDNNIVSSGKGGRNLSGAAVVAIIVSDIIGIILIASVFLSCYWRKVHRNGKDEGGNSGMAQKGQLKFLCSGKEESETISENAEPFNLVPFDSHVGFDLDELLKSSAFVLGKSKIGIVYRVLLDDRRTLAVRRLGGGMQRFKEFCMEAEAIGKVRHPNIVTLRAYYWSPDQKLLVYDYIPNGDLSAAIHGKGGTIPFSPMPWLVRLTIMSGIAKGLAYLHEFSPRKYIHGELKPTNILLGPNMEPYISDFGLRRLANIAGECPARHSNRIAAEEQQNQPSEVSMKQPASPGSCYQAPEALKVIKPSQKWDVYSFGVILLELISGRSPVVLSGTSDMNLVTWVRINIEEKKPLSDVLDPCLSGEPDRQEAILSVLKMALACVQTNAERRPSMQHVSETLDKLTTNS